MSAIPDEPHRVLVDEKLVREAIDELRATGDADCDVLADQLEQELDPPFGD